jgi:hypothetical protein
MRIIALIPYFGGDSSEAHSDKKNRPGYLQRTVDSLIGFADSIMVGTMPGEDRSVIPDGVTSVILHPTEPFRLPYEMVKFGQGLSNYDLVYYTEADQVLHYDPAVLKHVHDRQYLSPHRIEQLVDGRDSGGTSGQGERKVEFAGNRYVLANGTPPEGHNAWYSVDGCINELYDPGDCIKCFGGAFLASKELFEDTAFPDSQIEEVSGFYLSNHAECRKTLIWPRFFVEHLSGLDHTRREAGLA